MEFGIFLNGYIPGPAAHQTELEHTDARSARREYVIFADKHNWKYAWLGEHHCAHRVLPHVGARGRDGLHRRADRLHPPRLGDHQPLAAQGAPGALRRARRHARPLHQQPLRVRHRPRRRQPRGRDASTSSTRTPPRRSGKRWSRRSRGCGSRSTTRSTASTSPCPRRTTCCPKPYGKGHPPIWVACGNPPTFNTRRRARHRRHRVQLRADLQPPRPHRRLQGRRSRSAPSRSGSSRTTT